MLERQIPVINRLGLHARASAKLVQLLGGFKAQATLVGSGREVNAKSIMGVLLQVFAQRDFAAAFKQPGGFAVETQNGGYQMVKRRIQ